MLICPTSSSNSSNRAAEKRSIALGHVVMILLPVSTKASASTLTGSVMEMLTAVMGVMKMRLSVTPKVHTVNQDNSIALLVNVSLLI